MRRRFGVALLIALLCGVEADADAALSISTASILPPGTVSVPYSFALAAKGGVKPYTWSITAGSLPPGLKMDTSGVLSGTPTSAGSFNFTAKVTDHSEAHVSQAFTLAINPPLQITSPPTLPPGSAGAAYSQTLTATGGSPPYSWSVASGSLPAGLSLNQSTGKIAGTPTSSGTFQFSVHVSDGLSASATKAFSITILATPLTVSPDTLPDATAGLLYSVPLTVSGGTAPYTWLLVGGALPPGILLGPSTGIIRGAPSATGTFPFTIQVSDSLSGASFKNLSITVRGSSVAISTTTLANAQLGVSYNQTLSANGGLAPYQWSISNGSLPPGLSLNPATGVISGAPTTAGNYSFLAQFTDNGGNSATQQLSITVTTVLSITSSSALPAGAVNAQYSQTLSATGGVLPYHWTVSAGSLPTGLALNPSTGEISGAPSGAGDVTFSVQVADAASHSATQTFNLTITSSLTITTDSKLPSVSLNSTYSQSLTATGAVPPYNWVVINGLLPPGIKLDASSGTLSGTPNSIGKYSFTIQVSDTSPIHTQKDFTLQVVSPAIPDVTLNGFSDTAAAAQQTSIDIQLAAPYPTTLSGQITASFEPDAVVPMDDPAIQFSTGGRSADFSIPANTTHAVFTTSQMALQTGTVAGVITLTITVNGSGASSNSDVGPAPVTLTRSIHIARSAPVIRSIAMSKTSSGFQVQITGFSTDRDVTEADVHFNNSALGSVQTTGLTVKLSDAASQWFKSAASAQFGSQFSLVLPFTIQGSTDSIGSVSVQLKNSQGTSNTSSASF